MDITMRGFEFEGCVMGVRFLPGAPRAVKDFFLESFEFFFGARFISNAITFIREIGAKQAMIASAELIGKITTVAVFGFF
ncbi:MAG: hypothetical protein WC882_04000 [Candidatus Gracilibacteria bacterium]